MTTGTIKFTITAGATAVTSYGLIYQSGLQTCPKGPMSLPLSGWTTNVASSISNIPGGSTSSPITTSITGYSGLAATAYSACAYATDTSGTHFRNLPLIFNKGSNPVVSALSVSSVTTVSASVRYRVTTGTDSATGHGLINKNGVQTCPVGPQSLASLISPSGSWNQYSSGNSIAQNTRSAVDVDVTFTVTSTFCAYATSGTVTYFSSEFIFNTGANPVITAVTASFVTSSSASVGYTITAGTTNNGVTAYGVIYQSGFLNCPIGPLTLPVLYWTTNAESAPSTIAVGLSSAISTSISATLIAQAYTVCAYATTSLGTYFSSPMILNTGADPAFASILTSSINAFYSVTVGTREAVWSYGLYALDSDTEQLIPISTQLGPVSTGKTKTAFDRKRLRLYTCLQTKFIDYEPTPLTAKAPGSVHHLNFTTQRPRQFQRRSLLLLQLLPQVHFHSLQAL